MEGKDEIKVIDIKTCTCYYFDDIMRLINIDFSNILLNGKIYEKILIYDISYKTFTDAKPLHIWFEKIDGVIKIYGGIRYLMLFKM